MSQGTVDPWTILYVTIGAIGAFIVIAVIIYTANHSTYQTELIDEIERGEGACSEAFRVVIHGNP